MSEQLHTVVIRGRNVDTYIRDSISPMTTLRFQYNKTNIVRSIYLPTDIDEQNYDRIVTEAVKKGIYEYNKSMKARKAYAKKDSTN